MYFERFFDRGLAQASYRIGCQESGEAIVVDPIRDVDKYLSAAEREGMRIVYVTETRVLHTPGHTPEHLSFLVIDRAASDDPLMVLTGDFLFVGDVGRPDLLESAVGIAGGAAEGARALYSSTRSILDLPDYVQVWPGHGAGSACGKAMGALPSTTLGYEKRTNWALGDQTEAEFVESVLDGQPDVPTYFGRMKELNRGGVAFFGVGDTLRRLDPSEVRAARRRRAGHIPGAIHIPLGHLPQRVDELKNGSPILVYCQSGGRSSIAASLLLASGVERVTNLQGGFTAWQALEGVPVE